MLTKCLVSHRTGRVGFFSKVRIWLDTQRDFQKIEFRAKLHSRNEDVDQQNARAKETNQVSIGFKLL